MRDPHIVSLTYKIVSPENVQYTDAHTLASSTAQLHLEIKDGLLKIEPKTHFDSVESARKVLDPYLRSWEIFTGVKSGRIGIFFTYLDAVVVDRNPSSDSNPIMQATDVIAGIPSVDKPILGEKRKSYPEPPEFFEVSADVETLWHRYQMYLDSYEPLLSMAYACLTFCEFVTSKNRKAFAKNFKFSNHILNKLGDLTSNKGDAKTARKFKNPLSRTQLINEERIWIEEAIKLLIRRVGERQHLTLLDEVTMSNLPPLK